MTELDQDTLKELIHYNPDTGVFTWRHRDRKWFATEGAFKTWNTRLAGKETGCLVANGYLKIGVLYHLYLSHRLAFLYMTGEFPPSETDHINHQKTDNRWVNLRSVSSRENHRNTRHRNTKSGHMGVYRDKKYKYWYAMIGVNGKAIRLGRFDFIEDAITCREAANIKYGFHTNHGGRG